MPYVLFYLVALWKSLLFIMHNNATRWAGMVNMERPNLNNIKQDVCVEHTSTLFIIRRWSSAFPKYVYIGTLILGWCWNRW